ncbi:DUF6107 family protein [Oricola sp.]|uniref:DUF6107 family protein n=1 Tax=Oricola sp. TaxID=1979950 RepID=UPI0025F4496C|nr:DUF6107 family protein [Oricola sp.]MCI5073509.1 DUF6107 family protein [Oricola sp.]
MTMTDLSPAASLWLAKCAGALAGAAISLAWLLPKSRREAGLRFLSSMSAGFAFGGAAGLAVAKKLGIAAALSPHEIALTGAALASLSIWWAIGFAVRFGERMTGGRTTGRTDDGR